MSSDPRHSGWWQALRRAYASTIPCPCGICGRWVRRGEPWDLDHVRPVARGGARGPVRVTHRSCNREQGMTIARGYRTWTAPSSRRW